MPKELAWTDAEDIGILLLENYPDVNPLEVTTALDILAAKT